jgi:hypothetical protein
MNIVTVAYTTTPGFAAQNQANIKAVMHDFRPQQYAGIHYHCCLCANRQTFIHTAFFNTAEDQQLLNELPSFIHFQAALKAACFEKPPKQEVLSLVGCSKEFFTP